MTNPPDGAFRHRFEHAEKWAKEFDNPERDAWQMPDQILDALHLQRNSLVADIGAGTGYFRVRIAKRIPEGRIFAADIERDMVRYLGERARLEHLTNLVPQNRWGDFSNRKEATSSDVKDSDRLLCAFRHAGSRTVSGHRGYC
jgi:cyclopropane fatty-acyl-phospholipid synthase-like methyltransferase